MQNAAMTEHESLNTVVHAAFRRDLARYDAALCDFRPDRSSVQTT